MAAVTVPNKLGGLARVVIHQKLLSEDEAITIQTATNNKQHSFISQLLQSRRFTALKIAQACFHAFGYPLLLLNMLNQDFLPGKDISPQLMKSYRAIMFYNCGDNICLSAYPPPQPAYPERDSVPDRQNLDADDCRRRQAGKIDRQASGSKR